MRRLAALLLAVVLLCTVAAPAADQAALRAATVRIVDNTAGPVGTGFWHQSGLVVTAAQNVAGAAKEKLSVIDADGRRYAVLEFNGNSLSGLAALRVEKPQAASLPLAKEWGAVSRVAIASFPSGYAGRAALCSEADIAGDSTQTSGSLAVRRRHFLSPNLNVGNTGAPVVDAATGQVVGVLVTPPPAQPPYFDAALRALKSASKDRGVLDIGGRTVEVTAADVLADAVAFQRAQAPIAVGTVADVADLRELLGALGYSP